VESVLRHHNVEKAKVDPKLACISQLADCVAMSLGMGLGIDGLCYTMTDYAAKTLGFTDENFFEDLLANIAIRIQEAPDILVPPK
jgi:hypothetical protein